MSWEVKHGDNRELLASVDADSVDAVVCDPPYELGFMGKKWDSSGIAYDVEFWREVYRVLKPGAHLVAFGGTRTYHRMAVAIEDAGFEVRDSLHWVYTQGFPKSLDISKAIDKSAGAEREIVGRTIRPDGTTRKTENWSYGLEFAPGDDASSNAKARLQTVPATDFARQWSGWGTALKPAHEPIVLARKPLAGTVAANVLQWGTGAVNVEECRVATDDGFEDQWDKPVSTNIGAGTYISDGRKHTIDPTANKPFGGRWPPNLILSHSRDCGTTCIPGCAVDEMERQSASSRMFPCFRYEPKPSRGEREAGCEAAGRHPTVKPIELMRWLCRLITPPAGLVVDPFCGSGTTGCAAVLEGFGFLGMERESEYVDIAKARISHWSGQAGEVDADKPSDKPVQMGLWGTR